MRDTRVFSLSGEIEVVSEEQQREPSGAFVDAGAAVAQ